MSNLDKTSPNKDGWVQDGFDHILHIGKMRKAVVISGCKSNLVTTILSSSPDFYSISVRSYFPFSDDEYNMRFRDAEEAKKHAIGVIKEWIQGILNVTESVENCTKTIID